MIPTPVALTPDVPVPTPSHIVTQYFKWQTTYFVQKNYFQSSEGPVLAEWNEYPKSKQSSSKTHILVPALCGNRGTELLETF